MHLPFMDIVNNTFPLGVSIIMCLVPVFMLKRFFTYKVEEPVTETQENAPQQIEEQKPEEATSKEK